jgi:hypothetical protein
MSKATVRIFRWFNGVLQTLERQFMSTEEAKDFSFDYADRHEYEETKVYDEFGELIEHRRGHHEHHQYPYASGVDELGIPPFDFK